ncbi:glutamine amidotransferase subunit PdxT [Fructobacillus ficulneus]|uniref:glutaminase n=1 Tax=Fructobacillus ficulneus TaxID=157463 RepID=A0A0K8MHZ4_9LACO|nr:glutamine amidotransferase subunit PdxT [Fructobacillus ficulneus]
MKIGILGLQGAVAEHVKMLEQCGVETQVIQTKEDINDIDGLVLPGGESTTMFKLLNKFDLLDDLR